MTMRKKIIIAVGIVFLATLYLFGAKWLIYYRIGIVSLPASDNRHEYIFNDTILPQRGVVYMALGDSLTSGVGVEKYEESYPFLLAQKIAATTTKVTHLNFSYPGAKSEDVLRDLVPRAAQKKADIVTVLVGTNDVMNGKVTDAQFRKNYEMIITTLLEQKYAKTYVISIPFVGTNSLFLPPFNYYYREKVVRFNTIIKTLAAEYDVHYIDLTTPTEKFASKVSNYYAKDNFHLSQIGYLYWSTILYDNLNK